MKAVNFKNFKFDWEKVLGFCKKNVRYISAGVIMVLLVVVLAVTVANKNADKKEQADTTEHGMSTFETDAIPEINTLIENYYNARSAGDISGVETYATPISDLEKSYITMLSQYIEGYENIQCYTKPGLNDGEYAVSVVMDMHFKEIEVVAPGLDFFYVRTNESGVYYIDNLYSQFNWQNREMELDSGIEAFITEYEKQADAIQLSEDVQSRYDKILAENETLKNMVDVTIPQAIQQWVTEVLASTEETTPEETTPEETTPEETTPEETTPEETTPEEEVSETVYATSNVNIRKEPEESSEKVGSATIGQSFTRTGTTDNGWSEVEYEGEKAYIKSEFLTDEASTESENDDDAEYLTEGTVITMMTGVNVRKSMSENADVIGTTYPGSEVEVIQSYEEGWTKVKWNGKTGYIKTELLLEN